MTEPGYAFGRLVWREQRLFEVVADDQRRIALAGTAMRARGTASARHTVDGSSDVELVLMDSYWLAAAGLDLQHCDLLLSSLRFRFEGEVAARREVTDT